MKVRLPASHRAAVSALQALLGADGPRIDNLLESLDTADRTEFDRLVPGLETHAGTLVQVSWAGWTAQVLIEVVRKGEHKAYLPYSPVLVRVRPGSAKFFTPTGERAPLHNLAILDDDNDER